MEGGKPNSRDASIAAYKRGMELMKHCQGQSMMPKKDSRISKRRLGLPDRKTLAAQ